MAVYITLMAVTFILMMFDGIIKHKKWIFLGLCLIFTLVSVIRYDVGTDYINTYVRVFGWLKAGLKYNYEPIFLWFNKFIIQHNGSAELMISICAAVTIPLFFHFIRNNVEQRYWLLAVYLFLVSTIYFATMNLVRQYLALTILLLGFDSLKQNQYLRYSIYVVIAFLIHTSAVMGFLFLGVYYIYSNKIWNKAYNTIFVIFYSVSVFCLFVDLRNVVSIIGFIIPSRYVGYLTSNLMAARNYSAILKQIVPNLIMFWMIKDIDGLKNKYPHFELCYVGWILYVIITNLFYGINMFIRLGYYFDYLIILIAPMLISYYKDNLYHFSYKNIRMRGFNKVVAITIVAYYTALTVYSIFLKGGHNVVPYRTIFSVR